MSKVIEPHCDKNLPYKVILDLDDEIYLSQAQALAQLFEDDIDNNGNLDFEKAMAAVQAQPELAIMGTINSNYKQSRQTLAVLAGGITEAVKNSGALGLSGSEHELNEELEETFGNLKQQEGKPWFVISKSDGHNKDKTVITYNLLYISQSPSTGALLSASLLLFQVATNASLEELLEANTPDHDQSMSEAVDPSHKSKFRIRYEKFEVEALIKGFAFVKPIV
jgi:hypothetical protein